MPTEVPGSFYLVLKNAGYLRARGDDARDWLERQTTNNVTHVTPDRAVHTVLTSPTGRILDVLIVVDDGDSLGLITLPGYAASTLRYLRGRIFFMDRVTVDDASSEFGIIMCDGADVRPVLGALGLERPLAPGEVASLHVADVPLRGVGVRGIWEGGCLLLVPAEHVEQVENVLEAAGVLPITEGAYEVLRVEAGRPAAGHELTQEYTPLEVGLEYMIAEGKCYPGQEVIARQITYDKVVRRLAKLCLDVEVPEGAQVRAEGKVVGRITSAVVSPRQGPIALAVLRRPYYEPGWHVEVVVDGGAVSGVVDGGLGQTAST